MSRKKSWINPYSTTGKVSGPYTKTGPTEKRAGTKSLERLRSEARNKRIAQSAEDQDGIHALERLSGVSVVKLTKAVPRKRLRLDDNEYLRKRNAELERQKQELLNRGIIGSKSKVEENL